LVALSLGHVRHMHMEDVGILLVKRWAWRVRGNSQGIFRWCANAMDTRIQSHGNPAFYFPASDVPLRNCELLTGLTENAGHEIARRDKYRDRARKR